MSPDDDVTCPRSDAYVKNTYRQYGMQMRFAVFPLVPYPRPSRLKSQDSSLNQAHNLAGTDAPQPTIVTNHIKRRLQDARRVDGVRVVA